MRHKRHDMTEEMTWHDEKRHVSFVMSCLSSCHVSCLSSHMIVTSSLWFLIIRNVICDKTQVTRLIYMRAHDSHVKSLVSYHICHMTSHMSYHICHKKCLSSHMIVTSSLWFLIIRNVIGDKKPETWHTHESNLCDKRHWWHKNCLLFVCVTWLSYVTWLMHISD